MDTVNSTGVDHATERMDHKVISTSVEPNGGLITPAHGVTGVGEDRVASGAISDQDTLEGVGLWEYW